MGNKHVLTEIAIFVVTGILFVMLMFKINSYVQAERRFQKMMMSDCMRYTDQDKQACDRMSQEKIWKY